MNMFCKMMNHYLKLLILISCSFINKLLLLQKPPFFLPKTQNTQKHKKQKHRTQKYRDFPQNTFVFLSCVFYPKHTRLVFDLKTHSKKIAFFGISFRFHILCLISFPSGFPLPFLIK